MSGCITRVVDLGNIGFMATCRNHPEWTPPGREHASSAIQDCKDHKALNLPTGRCGAEDCTKPARMAISTKRPNRNRLTSSVDYDDRSAPKGSTRYCKQHGIEIMIGLMQTMVNDDEEPQGGTEAPRELAEDGPAKGR